MDNMQFKPVKVNADTVGSFFRLEEGAMKLAEKGLFPFSPDSEKFAVTAEDIIAAAENIGFADRTLDYRIWIKLFCEDGTLTEIPEPELPGYTEAFLIKRTAQSMEQFVSGNEKWKSIMETVQCFRTSEGKPVSEMKVAADDLVPMLESFEVKSEETDLPEEYGKLYEKLLDENWENGNIKLMTMRAKAYNGGSGLARCNWKKAEETYIKMLKEYVDSAEAALELGNLYSSGFLGEPDYDKAFEFYTDAAGSGNIIALCKISDMYRFGHGVKQNYDKVWSILEPLYGQMLEFGITGRPEVYANLLLRIGYCYRDGCGVSRDAGKACEYFNEALEKISDTSLADTYKDYYELYDDIENAVSSLAGFNL